MPGQALAVREDPHRGVCVSGLTLHKVRENFPSKYKSKVKSVHSVGMSCKQADFLYFATANICRRAAGNARVW